MRFDSQQAKSAVSRAHHVTTHSVIVARKEAGREGDFIISNHSIKITVFRRKRKMVKILLAKPKKQMMLMQMGWTAILAATYVTVYCISNKKEGLVKLVFLRLLKRQSTIGKKKICSSSNSSPHNRHLHPKIKNQARDKKCKYLLSKP